METISTECWKGRKHRCSNNLEDEVASVTDVSVPGPEIEIEAGGDTGIDKE